MHRSWHNPFQNMIPNWIWMMWFLSYILVTILCFGGLSTCRSPLFFPSKKSTRKVIPREQTLGPRCIGSLVSATVATLLYIGGSVSLVAPGFSRWRCKLPVWKNGFSAVLRAPEGQKRRDTMEKNMKHIDNYYNCVASKVQRIRFFRYQGFQHLFRFEMAWRWFFCFGCCSGRSRNRNVCSQMSSGSIKGRWKQTYLFDRCVRTVRCLARWQCKMAEAISVTGRWQAALATCNSLRWKPMWNQLIARNMKPWVSFKTSVKKYRKVWTYTEILAHSHVVWGCPESCFNAVCFLLLF